jgi:hypothetical protein
MTPLPYVYAVNYAVYVQLLKRCGVRNPIVRPIEIDRELP